MINNDANIAILGGRGMLGSDLALACELHGLRTNVLDLPDFDITNSDHLQQAVNNAQIIINCASYTNVDKAESEPDLTYQVNAEAVGRVSSQERPMCGSCISAPTLFLTANLTGLMLRSTRQIR
jgi:dTDP-4-dehydrorhamnose reductase